MHTHMRLLIAAFAAALAMTAGAAITPGKFAAGPINDLALIYQGGTFRPDWTQSEFEPYVTHTFADGTRRWTFDGFLFLEFRRQGDVTYANGYGKGSTRADWEWLMNRIFERGKALDALDKCISQAKRELGDPGVKHKVVLMLPSPENGRADWGSVNGRRLNFNRIDDKQAAVEWYLQAIYDRFNRAGFKNLELNGFYWIEETTTSTGRELPTRVSRMVHKLGKLMYWIPFFGARNNDQGAAMGFDMVYLQPNYFVGEGLTTQRLTDAITNAKRVGSALEMEIDEGAYYQAKTHNEALANFDAYTTAYERAGVWQSASVAYYLGGTAWADMAKSSNRRDRQVIDRLARIIANRHSTLNAGQQVQKSPSTNGSQGSGNTTKKKWWQLDWHF